MTKMKCTFLRTIDIPILIQYIFIYQKYVDVDTSMYFITFLLLDKGILRGRREVIN